MFLKLSVAMLPAYNPLRAGDVPQCPDEIILRKPRSRAATCPHHAGAVPVRCRKS